MANLNALMNSEWLVKLSDTTITNDTFANNSLTFTLSKDYLFDKECLTSQQDSILCANKSRSTMNVAEKTQQLSPLSTFQVGLISGAVAGAVVDFILFPLDTLKTRLQMRKGVKLTPQIFQGIYRGLGPALAASAPAGAAFFGTYDLTKRITSQWITPKYQFLSHILAAIAGDIAGSSVRVPFEVVKQNLQASVYASSRQAVRSIIQQQGMTGLYKGWLSLVLREIPFDIIEFPLYEFLKSQWKQRRNGKDLYPWQSASCGSIAGALAAAVTTPLDVAKTRVMLQTGSNKYQGITQTLIYIAKEEGVPSLFSGVVPRVLWIGLGGAIFFGSYETCKTWLTNQVEQ
eukprot:jgi/Galph1/1744/GphlegSOOS_G409.1